MAVKPYEIHYVENDTLPALKGTITEDDGTPVDLSGATVALHIKYDKPLVKVAQITAPENGQFFVTWTAGNLQAGRWLFEIQVTDAHGGIRTWNRAEGKPLTLVIDAEVA